MNHPLLYNAFCEDDVASGDRHITFDDKGVLCMTVVDPVTRKLLIPLNHVYPTRAQQRTTIPSLCQLFLNGRCRQGAQCHQVHASPDMVTVLRSQVETLPRCCALHGDRDYVGVMDDQSWVSRVVVHVADAAYEGGYIPLSRFSYTIPVRNMLKDLNTRCRSGCPGELVAIDDGPRKWMVLNTHEVKLCELHILDRCRYAEECIFLHICKELTSSISGTSADATTTTPLPHVKKDKEGRAGKKSSIFVSISRQQRVCGAPLFYSASEPPEPHYAWAYGAAASNNSASDVNSDSFKAVGCYPIDTAEMGSKRPEAPFPVQQCLAHVQQKARRQSATTPSMTAAASSGDEGAVDSGGSRSFLSLPEQGGLRAATGCANVGYHPYIHNDCHCADCNGYYSSNGCGCCEYCVVNDYGLDSYGQYNYVIDDRHCTSQAAAVGSPSVQHPAAVFLSGRSWHHNPYGSGLKNGAVF